MVVSFRRLVSVCQHCDISVDAHIIVFPLVRDDLSISARIEAVENLLFVRHSACVVIDSPSGYCRTAQNFRNEKGQNFRNRQRP